MASAAVASAGKGVSPAGWVSVSARAAYKKGGGHLSTLSYDSCQAWTISLEKWVLENSSTGEKLLQNKSSGQFWSARPYMNLEVR